MIYLDIEMPQNCDECPFFDDRYDYPTCCVNQLSSGYNFPIRNKRMSFCPLKEVKEDTAENNYNFAENNDKMQDSAIKVDLISRQEILDLPRIKHEPIKGYGIIEYINVDDIKKLPTYSAEHTKNPTKDIDSAIEYWKSVDEDNNMVKWLMKLQEYRKAEREKAECNKCKYYEGIHNVMGHAPCSFWNISGVMWNDYCSRFNHISEKEIINE